jgi:hypothetical protein
LQNLIQSKLAIFNIATFIGTPYMEAKVDNCFILVYAIEVINLNPKKYHFVA